VSIVITDEYGLDFDLQVLSRQLFLFNIARRHVTAYPDDHPLIARAMQNFLLQLDQLLEFSDEITIGVARDTLLIGNATLGKKAVFTDLAQILFACDIAAFTLRRSVTGQDLSVFFRLLAEPIENIRSSGGFSTLLPERGVTGVGIIDINYAAFHSTELDVIEAAESSSKLSARFLSTVSKKSLSQQAHSL